MTALGRWLVMAAVLATSALLLARSNWFKTELADARQLLTYIRLCAISDSLTQGVRPDRDAGPFPLPTDRWVSLGAACQEHSELVEILREARPGSADDIGVCDAFGHPILIRGLGDAEPPATMPVFLSRWAAAACGPHVTWSTGFEVRSVGADGVLSEPHEPQFVLAAEAWRDQVLVYKDGWFNRDATVPENRGPPGVFWRPLLAILRLGAWS